LDAAQNLADGELAYHQAIEVLGEGWVAEEALAIGVYCALAAHDFQQGVLWAVNHGGDSDSTGSIAGNLLGALRGIGAVPTEWRRQVELRDVIEEIANDLAEFPGWKLNSGSAEDDTTRKLWAKYPGY
jgi:ADP-ribosylglycohydrolase